MPVGSPLTDLMIRNQINSLRRLHGILEMDGVKTRDEFHDMMAAAFGHGGLELRALSDDLGFSFSSVFRWQEGKSAPHPSIWPTVTNWVMAKLAVQVKLKESVLAEHEPSEFVS